MKSQNLNFYAGLSILKDESDINFNFQWHIIFILIKIDLFSTHKAKENQFLGDKMTKNDENLPQKVAMLRAIENGHRGPQEG